MSPSINEKVRDAYLSDIKGAVYEEARWHRRRVALMRAALDAGVTEEALADAVREFSPDAAVPEDLRRVLGQ